MEDYKTQGDNFYNNNDYLNAVSMYSLGLSCKQENESYLLKMYLNRNLSYMKLNRYEDAMNDAQSAIKLDCNNAKAWGRLGSALCALGRFKKANDAFKLSYKIEPNELLFEQINNICNDYVEDTDTEEEDTDTEDEDNIVVNKSNTNTQVKNFLQQFYKNGHVSIPDITKSINNILTNNEILNKIKDNNFQNEIFNKIKDNNFQNKVMDVLKDDEIVNTINNIFKNINKTL